jgi:hypothetical protein
LHNEHLEYLEESAKEQRIAELDERIKNMQFGLHMTQSLKKSYQDNPIHPEQRI